MLIAHINRQKEIKVLGGVHWRLVSSLLTAISDFVHDMYLLGQSSENKSQNQTDWELT